MNSSPRGFSLVEILITIAIMGLLLAVISVSMTQARAKAADAKRKTDLHTLLVAVNRFYTDNDALPLNSSGACGNLSGTHAAAVTSALVPAYIPELIHDSKHAGTNSDYFYANRNNTNGSFTLCAALEQETGFVPPVEFSSCPGWTPAYNYCISQI